MRLLGWVLSSLALVVVALAVGGVVAFQYFSRDLPDFSQLATYEPPVTTRLHAADGRLLAEYAVENRVFTPIAAMPPMVLQAFVSAEDQHFYRHPGIDLQGILRAAITNLENLGSGRRLIGASTITQQVARTFMLTNEVNWERKIREALLALRIEQAYSKERILELYLNQIYLGRGAYGVAAAALAYFDKPLADLSVAEAAYLAALPKAPNNYDPDRRHDAAVARRDYVIDRMAEDGAIDGIAALAAKAEPLATRERAPAETVTAAYFAESVRRELQRIYGTDQLYEGGLSVRTSLDSRLQEIADRALRDGLRVYDRRHGWRGPVAKLTGFDDWPGQLAGIARPAGIGDWRLAVVLEVDARRAVIGLDDRGRGEIPFEEVEWARPWREGQRLGPEPGGVDDVLALGDVVLVEPARPAPAETPDAPLRRYALEQIPAVQGALVAMDPNTGRVLAISGGYDPAISEFNRATQALRQPGSSFKPFVYLAALEAGYTPTTIVDDAPIVIDAGEGAPVWRPDNYSHDFLGPTPLRMGVEKSRNLMTVRLLQAIGLERVHDVARRFGVYADMPLLYSMALGAGETTPLALTTAYAMIANGGKRIVPTFIDRIQDRTGATVYRHDERACEGCVDTYWADQAVPTLPDEREQVTDPVVAYQMTSILEGVVQRGTAASLHRLGITLAGKTGTTNDSKDAWFVGFAPDLAVGVFVGFDDPTSLGGRETGGAAAVPIFGAFMSEALGGQEVPPFRIPPAVSLVRIDRATGQPAGDGGGEVIWEAFRPGTEPGTGYAFGLLPDAGPIPAALTSFGDSLPSAIAGTGGLY